MEHSSEFQNTGSLVHYLRLFAPLMHTGMGRPDEVSRLHPHSVRGIVTSWAEIANRVSASGICCEATWMTDGCLCERLSSQTR